MEPFKKRSVYSWQMNGSYSLKSALPAVRSELSYENLAIRDGGMAMSAYRAMTRSADPAQVGRLRQALSEYCGLDTLAMVRILERLRVAGSAATGV
ncbi:MAG: hypothetical protein ACYDAA_03660 [Syntrophales bacterium]